MHSDSSCDLPKFIWMRVAKFFHLNARTLIRSPRSRRRSLRRRARLVVCLFAVTFLFALIAVWAVGDQLHPSATDPDYCTRRDLLRQRMAEAPGSATVVMLGSSRSLYGFAPEEIPATITRQGQPLVWFNCAHNGAGPILQLVILKRLLADGLRPDLVSIEIMPSYVTRDDSRFLSHFLSFGELASVRPFVRIPELAWNAYRHRFSKPEQMRRVILGPEPMPSRSHGGLARADENYSKDERARRLAVEHRTHLKVISEVVVSASADMVFREMLTLCRMHGIQPVMILSPEGSNFQSWYDSARWTRFQERIERFADEQGVVLINARNWLTEEQFVDSHHPTEAGAKVFTTRFVEELKTVWDNRSK